VTDQKFRAALSKLAREFVDAMVADLLRGDLSGDVHVSYMIEPTANSITASASPPAERLLLVALTADEIRLVAAALSVQTQFAVIAPGLADTTRVEKMQDVRARLMARLTREG
jgi:hypothetical protein